MRRRPASRIRAPSAVSSFHGGEQRVLRGGREQIEVAHRVGQGLGLVVGQPGRLGGPRATVVERIDAQQCRETTGRTLTFFTSTDSVVVDRGSSIDQRVGTVVQRHHAQPQGPRGLRRRRASARRRSSPMRRASSSLKRSQ